MRRARSAPRRRGRRARAPHAVTASQPRLRGTCRLWPGREWRLRRSRRLPQGWSLSSNCLLVRLGEPLLDDAAYRTRGDRREKLALSSVAAGVSRAAVARAVAAAVASPVVTGAGAVVAVARSSAAVGRSDRNH